MGEYLISPRNNDHQIQVRKVKSNLKLNYKNSEDRGKQIFCLLDKTQVKTVVIFIYLLNFTLKQHLKGKRKRKSETQKNLSDVLSWVDPSLLRVDNCSCFKLRDCTARRKLTCSYKTWSALKVLKATNFIMSTVLYRGWIYDVFWLIIMFYWSISVWSSHSRLPHTPAAPQRNSASVYQPGT